MARQLLGLINGESDLPNAVVLPTELVVRSSLVVARPARPG